MENNRYLFAPPFCEKVETFILPIPKFKFETSNGLRIAGGWRYFDQLRVIQRKKNTYVEVIMTPKKLLRSSKIHCKSSLIKAELNLENITKKRPAYSTCPMSQPQKMSVINRNTDSSYKNRQKKKSA
mgnify:FL=1